MRKIDIILRYFLYFFLIVIGVIIGITVQRLHNMPMAETVNLIDLATLVVTIFLAVYIPEVLDRKLQIQRDKKDLIEKRIDEFQVLVKKVNLLVQDDFSMTDKDYLRVVNALDVSMHKLGVIATLLKSSDMGSFDADIAKIRKLCKEHRELLTSGKTPGEGAVYTTQELSNEEEIFNKIDEAASILMFKISDAR